MRKLHSVARQLIDNLKVKMLYSVNISLQELLVQCLVLAG